MKKFVVLLVVAALTCFGTSAFAAHEEESTQPGIVKAEPGVTSGVAMSFSGSIDIRERFYNLGVANSGGYLTDLITGSNTSSVPARTTNTQERIRFNVDAKVGDYLNGRISIENDWDTFGRNESPQGNGATAPSWSTNTSSAFNANNGRLDIREAWVNFMLPGTPVGIKGGHQLLQLGNGWFYRAMKYGADAWVGYWGSGNNTLALYDVRVGENAGQTGQPDQDIDFYGVLDAYKLADGVVSFDLTWASAPAGGVGGTVKLPNKTNVYNLGLSYAAKTGPVHLKLEVDAQSGKADDIDLTLTGTQMKFKGYQAVLQGSVPMDPLSINFTLAYGSGNKPGEDKDFKQMFTVLDNDQHYTLIYEYLEPAAGTNATNLGTANEQLHAGFANTMAANLGLMFNLSKILAVGLDYWYLQAVEDVALMNPQLLNGGTKSNKLGNEVDFKLNWKLYDNLTWNWQVGWFKHGDAYKLANGNDAEDSTAVLGMLSFKF